MKKHYILLVFALLISVASFAQYKKHSQGATISHITQEQRGDSLYVELLYDISNTSVYSRSSVNILPILIKGQNSISLPEVQIKGRKNYNLYRRELSLMNKKQRNEYEKNKPYAVLKGFKSTSQKTVKYVVSLGYEQWMSKADLNICEAVENICGSDSDIINVTNFSNIHVIPYLAYLLPEVESVKRRELAAEVFLDFVVNKIDIRPDYMNNPHEMKKVTDLISEIRDDKDVTVKSISVIGYASPEGPHLNNKRLSIGRANALVSYLVPQFDYPQNMYKVEGGDENWVGLREAVEKSDMQYKSEILDIIANVPVLDIENNIGRNKSLMDLKGGVPYNYMLENIYPKLRKAICKVEFEIRNFDVTYAKELVKTRPENLSLNEMFLVANTYQKGSKEFNELFEIAVGIYPSDPTANLNAASAALAKNDIATAEKYLKNIGGKIETAEYYNALGVLYMLRGEYKKAEVEFAKAISKGLDEAKQNMALIKKRLAHFPSTITFHTIPKLK